MTRSVHPRVLHARFVVRFTVSLFAVSARLTTNVFIPTQSLNPYLFLLPLSASFLVGSPFAVSSAFQVCVGYVPSDFWAAGGSVS